MPTMKNFSMPKYISPTLELDELMRLKRGLETTISKESSEFDVNTVKAIRQNCYCNENGRLEETAKELKLLYTKMFTCECPMLEETALSQSLTWCQCTAEYNKKLFELVFEAPVDEEILQSIRQGFDYCLLRVTFIND